MNRITVPIELLENLDEIGEMVMAKGIEVLKLKHVRDKVARLLAIHKKMDKTHKTQISVPKDPHQLMTKLEKFRKFLKNIFQDKNLPLPLAHEIADWDRTCKVYSNRVGVLSAGLSPVNSGKVSELKETGNGLVEKGGEFLKMRAEGVRIPFFVITAIRVTIKEVLDILHHVETTNLKIPAPKTSGLPQPMYLTQAATPSSTQDYSAVQKEFLRRPRRDSLSLSQRRASQVGK